MYDELLKRLRECTAEMNGEKTLWHQAADAIEELQQITTHYEEESKGWWLAACDAKEERERLKEQLDNAEIENIKLKEEFAKYRGKNRWIPVTVRLPNCNGCYLVWRPHFFGGEIGMPSICYFDGSNAWHDSYGVDFERILHPEDVTNWMPLPQPPEREGEP